LQETIKTSPRLLAKGGGSKSALSHKATLELAKLRGVLEYDPQEYTLTALAGTPLKTIEDLLAQEGQFMPFDPVMIDAGSTLGGAIASGLSGSGRYRYGGIRDFLLGIKFITGAGNLHTGGGKVIKNASGFDLPKLMVGSLGRFGVLTEATIKVFPKPEVFTSLVFELGTLEKALESMSKLTTSAFELSCLDIDADGKLYVRFGGLAQAAKKRLERLQAFVGLEGQVLDLDADAALWRNAREFTWLKKDYDLIKVPLTLSKILALNQALPSFMQRRYAVGGNVAWLGFPSILDKAVLAQTAFSEILLEQGLSGLALTGDWFSPYLGKHLDHVFTKRLLSVLDAEAKFQLA
jgi:glycolate oxidase FAD binding subunit